MGLNYVALLNGIFMTQISYQAQEKIFSPSTVKHIATKQEIAVTFINANPMNTKTYCCKKVSYLARSCWNPLPSEIKNIKSVKQFKESLKSHILSEY